MPPWMSRLEKAALDVQVGVKEAALDVQVGKSALDVQVGVKGAALDVQVGESRPGCPGWWLMAQERDRRSVVASRRF